MKVNLGGGIAINKIGSWAESVKEVTDTSSIIASANNNRKAIIIQNLGVVDCYYSKSGPAVSEENLMIGRDGGEVRYTASAVPVGPIECITKASSTIVIVSEGY